MSSSSPASAARSSSTKRRISACGTGDAPTRSGSSAAESSASPPPQAARRAVAADAARSEVTRKRMVGVLLRGDGGRPATGWSDVGEPARPVVAGPLEGLHDDEQEDDGQQGDVGRELLVAEADGEVAEPATADGAGHRGVADERDDGDRGPGDEGGPRLREQHGADDVPAARDRKSTRLNSSHANTSYAVFCLKKKHLLRLYDLAHLGHLCLFLFVDLSSSFPLSYAPPLCIGLYSLSSDRDAHFPSVLTFRTSR